MNENAAEVGAVLPDLGPNDILTLLPHRYPMLMVDRLVEIRAHQSAVGIKNVTFGEPYFQGHFPDNPVMPGVLQVEAVGQAAGILVVRSTGMRNVGVFFASIEKCKFRKPVLPGDQLRIEVEQLSAKLGLWRFAGKVKVDGAVTCEVICAAKVMPGED